MRIDIHVDRPGHSDRRDPVVARAGVFGHLEPEALTEAERTRDQLEDKRAAKAKGRGVRVWLPQDITKYLTKIYGRFSNPFKSKGGGA